MTIVCRQGWRADVSETRRPRRGRRLSADREVLKSEVSEQILLRA
jgi:hypothetical protein